MLAKPVKPGPLRFVPGPELSPGQNAARLRSCRLRTGDRAVADRPGNADLVWVQLDRAGHGRGAGRQLGDALDPRGQRLAFGFVAVRVTMARA